MKPLNYMLDHVDVDLHASFPLVLAARVRPAPILDITNVSRVRHAHHAEGAIYYAPPLYRRVIRRGDWT